MNYFYKEVPAGLRKSIQEKINTVRLERARIRTTIFGTISVGSLAGMIGSLEYFWQNILQSGFYHYFSLLFSDGGILLNYWKEFSLSLIESLPLVGCILVLSALGLFIWSLTKTLREAESLLTA